MEKRCSDVEEVACADRYPSGGRGGYPRFIDLSKKFGLKKMAVPTTIKYLI